MISLSGLTKMHLFHSYKSLSNLQKEVNFDIKNKENREGLRGFSPNPRLDPPYLIKFISLITVPTDQEGKTSSKYLY